MNSNFLFTTSLQYKVKSLTARVQAFESGEKYTKMQTEYKSHLSKKDREIRTLKSALADANSRIVTVRNYWSQVFDDLEKEHVIELGKKERKIKGLEERALKAERQRDDLKTKLNEKSRELYQVKTELEEEQGKNQQLIIQINRDYSNSSIPSSAKLKRKKISNSRETTVNKPGGQPGHAGHRRKKLEPTNRIHVPEPEIYSNSPDYKPTGKQITKQMINIHTIISVDEYYTQEFRKIATGQRVHAEFPAGVVNDVNYGGSIKAFLFMLNNYCNVSIDKTREFLSELTHGKLNISKGMINGLSKEFSDKTIAEQREAFSDLLLSPVMNTDGTNARVGGKSAFVYVCATPVQAMYFAREHKGHRGVKATPVEDYQGILVHDHDVTFYNYGSDHQECLAHPLRYLLESIENEPQLEWNKQMRELLQEMIHYRKSVDSDMVPDAERIDKFKERYRAILALAQKEYEYEPPSRYYRNGYNLSKRMDKYMDNHLLFLHNAIVPPDNNLSERLLRIFKRKLKQVMTLRSFDSLDYLCRCMGIIASLRSKNENLYQNVAKIFD
jgi:hypothetical protein